MDVTLINYDVYVSSASGPQHMLQMLFGRAASTGQGRNDLIRNLYLEILQHIDDETVLGKPIFELLKIRAGIVSRLGLTQRFLFRTFELQVFLCMCHSAFRTFCRQVGFSRFKFTSMSAAHAWEIPFHMFCFPPPH